MESDNLFSLLSCRHTIYDFLARIFEKEISEPFLDDLCRKRPVLEDTKQGISDEELEKGFKILNGYLEGLRKRNLKQATLELAVDYANLFLGVKALHPSESFYKSKEHMIMQEPMDEVLGIYRSAGVVVREDFTEPPDHIAVELQFMAYLCQKTLEALKKGEKNEVKRYLNTQNAFLNKHLSWLPLFLKDILATAQTDFYKAIAIISKRFVELDAVLMSTILLRFVD
jgi:anaerobic sulfite reductase subunit A